MGFIIERGIKAIRKVRPCNLDEAEKAFRARQRTLNLVTPERAA